MEKKFVLLCHNNLYLQSIALDIMVRVARRGESEGVDRVRVGHLSRQGVTPSCLTSI